MDSDREEPENALELLENYNQARSDLNYSIMKLSDMKIWQNKPEQDIIKFESSLKYTLRAFEKRRRDLFISPIKDEKDRWYCTQRRYITLSKEQTKLTW